MSRNDRADHAKDRAMTLAAMVRDESPDSVACWLRGMTDEERIDLLLVTGAALPQTTKGFQAAWAWVEEYAPTVNAREVVRARQRGFRDADIAKALGCRTEDLPPRIRVA
jgi:hypothetical protein